MTGDESPSAEATQPVPSGDDELGAEKEPEPEPVVKQLQLEAMVTSATMDELGMELWMRTVLYLDAPDLLSLLHVNKAIHRALESNKAMWAGLLQREKDLDVESPGYNERSSRFTQGYLSPSVKMQFLIRSLHRNLPVVTWRWASSSRSARAPRARAACVLGNALVLTEWNKENGILVSCQSPACCMHDGFQHDSSNDGIAQVNGETLTPIDHQRAVRFGGFRSGRGGASAETVVLRVKEGSDSMFNTTPLYYVDWQFPTIQTQSGLLGPPPGLARGFHASVLVCNRYLLVMGGMQSTPLPGDDSSWMQGMLLDTETWTWLDQTIVATPNCNNGSFPASRHSFSLVWDELRQRFLVFGGSNENEHSGGDLADVWQLVPRKKPLEKPLLPETWLASLPWEWSLLHENAWDRWTPECREATEDSPLITGESPTHLSPNEALCLGRSHAAHHVTKDTVVFMFGSSKPSSNGLLVYNLRHDTFGRPRVQGGLPSPRLLCTSVYVPKFRAIYLTGGWSVQGEGPVEKSMETLILQMIPAVLDKKAPAPSGKWFEAFDFVPPREPSTGRYPSLAHWHGYEIEDPVPPLSDSQVLDIRRQNGPSGQHLQMMQFVNSAEDEDASTNSNDDDSLEYYDL